MSIEIVIPDVGEPATEVTVTQWLKQDKDAVKLDEEVCEIETDKIVASIISPADGFLRIKVQEGESISTGAVIGIVVSTVESSESTHDNPSESSPNTVSSDSNTPFAGDYLNSTNAKPKTQEQKPNLCPLLVKSHSFVSQEIMLLLSLI